ncbi:MAG: CoA-binding protein [Acidobacteriota bacterium]
MSQTLAVLGASTNRHKFGNKCVRAFAHAGWSVVPVNPKPEPIEGFATARSLADITVPLDAISVYLPPPVTASMLEEIAAAEAGTVWFNPGAADADVLRKADDLGIAAHDACSIVAIGLSPSQFPG